MSKNKNLHDIIYHEDETMSIGNYDCIMETGDRGKDGHKLYRARCKTCGSIIIKNLNDLKRMSLKCNHSFADGDGTSRLVYGVGVNDMPRGWLSNTLHMRIYDLWRHMLLRTTAKYWEMYPTYTGTTVCNEWIYLKNFVNDIVNIDGYDLWEQRPDLQMMLDKDTKIIGNKHYSPDTCCFISHTESNQDVHKRHPETQLKAAKANSQKHGIKIKAIETSTMEVRIFSSQKEAGRELSIPAANIWMILSDDTKYASHKTAKSKDGKVWTFEKYFIDTQL